MNDKSDVNTKQALLNSAIEVFADKGFDAATIRDICSKAKANVAAVNYHYGGKDALYVAVLEEVFPREMPPHTDSSMPPEERLKRYLSSLASEIYERNNAIIAQRWSIFLREMAKPSTNLDFLVKRQIQPRANELREIVADILGPDAPDHLLAFSCSNIWALMLDHVLTQPILDRLEPKRPDLDISMDAFIDHAVAFSLGGLMAVKQTI